MIGLRYINRRRSMSRACWLAHWRIRGPLRDREQRRETPVARPQADRIVIGRDANRRSADVRLFPLRLDPRNEPHPRRNRLKISFGIGRGICQIFCYAQNTEKRATPNATKQATSNRRARQGFAPTRAAKLFHVEQSPKTAIVPRPQCST